MGRRQEEFYCSGGCGKYFKTNLLSSMVGNYTIECPNCKHHHFRVIEGGLITDERHSDEYSKCKSELIIGLKATVQDTPYHNDPIFRRNSLRAYDGGRR